MGVLKQKKFNENFEEILASARTEKGVIYDWKENRILYDWLSFTSKIHSIGDLIKLLGLENVTDWVVTFGRYGYRRCQTFNGISIHFDGFTDGMGILVEISGQGCRAFETFGNGNYEQIVNFILSYPGEMNITRLDIAFDDFSGALNLNRMERDTNKGYFTSKSRRHRVTVDMKNIATSKTPSKAITITHGSKSSNIFIRVYDKAKERGYEDGRHWVRFEVVLKNENAESFIALNMDLKEKMLGVVNNYLCYRLPNPDDTNKNRWKIALYWAKFINNVQKVRLYNNVGIEYNEYKLHNFIFGQMSSSISTYYQMIGRKKFMHLLVENKKSAKLNQKQKRLLADCNSQRGADAEQKRSEFIENAKLIAEEMRHLGYQEAVRKFTELDTLLKMEEKYLNLEYIPANEEFEYRSKLTRLNQLRRRPVVDVFGVRWIRCGVCGKILRENEFPVIYSRFSNKVNDLHFGLCSDCSKIK